MVRVHVRGSRHSRGRLVHRGPRIGLLPHQSRKLQPPAIVHIVRPISQGTPIGKATVIFPPLYLVLAFLVSKLRMMLRFFLLS